MRAAWWWIDRWRTSSAFASLSMAEQGAYRNLLDELWLRDGFLPDDDRTLERASGAGSEWPKLRDKVLDHFAPVPGGYRHTTHDEVQAESKKRANKQQRYRDKKRNVTSNVTGNGGTNVPASPSLSLDLDPGPEDLPPCVPSSSVYPRERAVAEQPEIFIPLPPEPKPERMVFDPLPESVDDLVQRSAGESETAFQHRRQNAIVSALLKGKRKP